MGNGRTEGITRSGPSVLILAMLMLAGVATCENDQVTRGSMERLEGGMPATGNGTFLRIEHAFEGETSLVWGHDGPGDLRIVDDNLTTLGVLPLPSPGFHVKGASISEGGVRAFVWGHARSGDNDTVIVYNLTTFEIDPGYLPVGLIDMVRVDYVASMAWGLILVVAGAHANGTSMLAFIETIPMLELKAYTLPGNASVDYLGTDGISLACLLEGGQLVVVSTRDWTVALSYHAVNGSFSSWRVSSGMWLLGGEDGTVVVWDAYPMKVWSELRLDGRVQGVAWTMSGSNQTLVVAQPGEGGGSVVRAYRRNAAGNWELATEEPWPVAVSMMGAHPTRGDAILVCGADGSVQPLEVRTWTDYVSTKVRWKLYIGVAVLILVGVAGCFLWSRRERPRG